MRRESNKKGNDFRDFDKYSDFKGGSSSGSRSNFRSGSSGPKGNFRGPSSGPRELHKAVCAECNKECDVPFKPQEGRPVYCRDCFSKHKPQRY